MTGQLHTQSFCCKKNSTSRKVDVFLMIYPEEWAHVTVEELKYPEFLFS